MLVDGELAADLRLEGGDLGLGGRVVHPVGVGVHVGPEQRPGGRNERRRRPRGRVRRRRGTNEGGAREDRRRENQSDDPSGVPNPHLRPPVWLSVPGLHGLVIGPVTSPLEPCDQGRCVLFVANRAGPSGGRVR